MLRGSQSKLAGVVAQALTRWGAICQGRLWAGLQGSLLPQACPFTMKSGFFEMKKRKL